MVTPPRPRTVQLKNISFKYPKPYQTANLSNNSLPIVIKDRMKQPIANDKTRCAVLMSNNGKKNNLSKINLRKSILLFRYFITFTIGL